MPKGVFMIKIEIEGVELDKLLDDITKTIASLEASMEKLTHITEDLYDVNRNQSEEIVKLQGQIIEMKTEDTKERRSFWEFLTGRNKPAEKKSRITETTVVLNK